MPTKWNNNKDKEFVDNLRLDYAAMDTGTLEIGRASCRERV